MADTTKKDFFKMLSCIDNPKIDIDNPKIEEYLGKKHREVLLVYTDYDLRARECFKGAGLAPKYSRYRWRAIIIARVMYSDQDITWRDRLEKKKARYERWLGEWKGV